MGKKGKLEIVMCKRWKSRCLKDIWVVLERKRKKKLGIRSIFKEENIVKKDVEGRREDKLWCW